MLADSEIESWVQQMMVGSPPSFNTPLSDYLFHGIPYTTVVESPFWALGAVYVGPDIIATDIKWYMVKMQELKCESDLKWTMSSIQHLQSLLNGLVDYERS